MKLIVKTIVGKQLPIEFEDSANVGQVKEIIEKEHQMPAAQLKLIHLGKVLEVDDKAISEYGIKDGEFIVAMVQKAKPVAKPKPVEEAKPEEKKEETKAEEPKPAQAQPAQPAPTQPPAQAVPAQAQPTAAAATQQLPPQVEQAITELISISGQSRENCVRALAAAHNQPDLAFEILMSGGLPEGDADMGGEEPYGEEGDDGAAMADAMAAMGGGPAAGGLDPAVQQQLAALVNNPSFPAIRQRLLTDQNFTQMFMQNLQTSQPQIFQAIQQNPAILMQLIQGQVPAAGQPGAGLPPMGGAGGAGAPGGQQLPPGTIQITKEEDEAIKRLESFGFSRVRAAEAYFACDKNEEFAANFLFEAGAEDEDVATQNAIAASQQMAGGAEAQPQPAAANAEQPAANQEAQPAAEQNNESNQDGGNADNSNNNNEGGNDSNQQPPGDGAGGSSLI